MLSLTVPVEDITAVMGNSYVDFRVKPEPDVLVALNTLAPVVRSIPRALTKPVLPVLEIETLPVPPVVSNRSVSQADSMPTTASHFKLTGKPFMPVLEVMFRVPTTPVLY